MRKEIKENIDLIKVITLLSEIFRHTTKHWGYTVLGTDLASTGTWTNLLNFLIIS